MTSNRKKVMDRFGKPDVVIDGTDIAGAETKWSFGLYSVIMNSFPDKLMISRAGNGVLYARAYNGQLTLVVIDGIPVRPDDYGFIESIPPSEVSSVELIEYAEDEIKEIDKSQWKLVSSEHHKADEKNEYDYTFETYQRINTNL